MNCCPSDVNTFPITPIVPFSGAISCFWFQSRAEKNHCTNCVKVSVWVNLDMLGVHAQFMLCTVLYSGFLVACLSHDGGRRETIFSPNKPVFFCDGTMKTANTTLGETVLVGVRLWLKGILCSFFLPSSLLIPVSPHLCGTFVKGVIPAWMVAVTEEYMNNRYFTPHRLLHHCPLAHCCLFCFHPLPPWLFSSPATPSLSANPVWKRLRKSSVSCLSRILCWGAITHLSDSYSVDTVQAAIWEI